MRVPTGAFVCRRNGKVFVTGNSGFPKSLDISKAIDKAAGAERELGPKRVSADGTVAHDASGKRHEGYERPWRDNPEAVDRNTRISFPSTDAAKLWNGYGTALKPAWEPIIVAMKPLDGTFAENAQRHGVAGLNIDGCRVETAGRPLRSAEDGSRVGTLYQGGFGGSRAIGETSLGRFPANLILSYPEDVYELRDDVTPEQLRDLAEWMDANP